MWDSQECNVVIVLIDGKVIYPKGNIQPDVLGLLIINGDEKFTIPHNQIKWIYENPEYKKEDEFLKNIDKLFQPELKPISITKAKTVDDLIDNLYEKK